MEAIAAILDFGSNDFCRFLLLKTPRCFLSSFKSIGLSFQEKRKTDFQDSNNGGHPGVSIGTICVIFIFIYKSPWWSPSRSMSIGLLVEEKRKIDFQDCRHLGFLTGTILAIFDLKVNPMLPTSFQLICLSDQEKLKIDFKNGGHLWFPIGKILALFDVQLTSKRLTFETKNSLLIRKWESRFYWDSS